MITTTTTTGIAIATKTTTTGGSQFKVKASLTLCRLEFAAKPIDALTLYKVTGNCHFHPLAN